MSPHQGGLFSVFREAHDLPGVSCFVVTVFYAALSTWWCFMLQRCSLIAWFVTAILNLLV